MSKWIGVLAVSLLTASAECGAAFAADNPLGFYVGAGLGLGNSALGFKQSDKFGWDALAGIRPGRYLGAELQYLNFGNATFNQINQYFNYGAHSHAVGAFGVAYLPLSWMSREVDLFGKLGVAQLWGPHPISLPTASEPHGVFDTAQETDLAYGGGAQAHFAAFAIRAEYEEVDASVGNPSLFSLEVTWTP